MSLSFYPGSSLVPRNELYFCFVLHSPFFFETPPVSQAAGQMPSKVALSCVYHSSHSHHSGPSSLCLSTPSLSLYSAFCWEAPLAMSCQYPSGLFIAAPNTADSQLWENSHPACHAHVPGSLGAASSPTLTPHLVPPRQFFLQRPRRTETAALSPQSACSDSVLGPCISARSRTRWLLLQTLMNNPSLVMLRKSKSGHGSQEFIQIPLTCPES